MRVSVILRFDSFMFGILLIPLAKSAFVFNDIFFFTMEGMEFTELRCCNEFLRADFW